jgi:elongation factor Ts
VAADGRVVILADGNRAVIAEVNSETDFVAKDDNFVAFAEAVAAAALSTGTVDVEKLGGEKIADGRTVEQARTDLITKVGENISVRRAEIVANDGPIGSYTHGARIGAIVALTGGDEELARDIAMHVAASNPQYLSADDVPEDFLASEREIELAKAEAEAGGKPKEIIAKMVEGRLRKSMAAITMLGQPFVRDPDMSVEKLLKERNAKVLDYVRYEVGAGIEKKQENFAEEVMAQVRGA